MPGPGGGSRGGGFGRGGGGHRPGGFGGPRPGGFHYPHHHYHRPFFGFRFPFFGFGYGGGCLGSLMGMMLVPIILIFIIISLVLSIFGSVGASISNIANGGFFNTDDSVMEDYCDRQYAIEFTDAVGYEDNILIVFLVDEDCEDYYTMAYVGYNINDHINKMFGNKYTEFGQAVVANINPNYKNSLTANLKATVNTMKDEIYNLRLSSSFDSYEGSPGKYQSHVTNHSSLDVNEEILNTALTSFTEETDIPMVIVIDDMSDVFDKRVNGSDIVTVILAVVLSGVAIYFVIRAFRDKNDRNGSDRRRDRYNNDPDDDRRSDEDEANNSTHW